MFSKEKLIEYNISMFEKIQRKVQTLIESY